MVSLGGLRPYPPDGGVSPYLALLDQLHDRRPGEEFRCGPGSDHRPLGIHGDLPADVRIAEPFLEEDISVLHYGNDTAGNIAPV
jgi:hypothetical protein